MRNLSLRNDRRPWHIILRDYHAREGSRVRVSLPKVRFLEERGDESERDERAA